MNRSEFLQKYKSNILTELLEYETQRQDLVFGHILVICGAIVCSIAYFFIVQEYTTIVATHTNMSLLEVIIMIAVFILGFRYWLYCLESSKAKNEDFLMEIKIKFLNKILKYFGDITWNVDKSKSKLKAENIIGEYKNVFFKILETKGDIYLTFKSNKNFKHETIVKNKNNINFKFDYRIISVICSTFITILIITSLINSDNKSGLILKEYILDSSKYLMLAIATTIYSIVSFCSFYKKFKQTKLEDVALARGFTVYTEDEIDARYFLTPTFIERFKNIQTVFGRKNISCSCKDDQVCFKIAKPKNLFEVCNIYKPLKNLSPINDLYDEINAIFKMIDYFKFAEDTKI